MITRLILQIMSCLRRGDRNIAYVDEYYGNKYIKSEQRKNNFDNGIL